MELQSIRPEWSELLSMTLPPCYMKTWFGQSKGKICFLFFLHTQCKKGYVINIEVVFEKEQIAKTYSTQKSCLKMYRMWKIKTKTGVCIFRFQIAELGQVDFYECRLYFQNQKSLFFIIVSKPGGEVLQFCMISTKTILSVRVCNCVFIVYEWIDKSSRVVSRPGGVWKTACIKIGYSEPRGAESQQGSSTLAKSSWVTSNSIPIGWVTQNLFLISR